MSDKTFKTPKNRALGCSKAINLAPGDIVTWKSWEYNLETALFEDKEGLLLEILEENRLQNTVLIAKIMPFGGEKHEFIPLISVKKSQKKDYL